MSRTTNEILERIKARTGADFFGFEVGDYVEVLPFDAAVAGGFLKEDVTVDQWPNGEKPRTAEEISDEAKSYLGFFLEKIEDERGISVVRAANHYVAWKWLLSHPDADTFPGAPNGPEGGWYQRDAYEYVKAQVDSGEWDRMTAEANLEAVAP